jgi:drug/metabolite transporter (DMT)-like permease
VTIDDKLTPSRAVGIVCGLIGVVVMIGPGALKGLSLHVVGELACLAAAALYATGTVYARRFRNFTPNALAAGQTGAATLLLLAPVAYVDHPWTQGPPVPHVIAALIGLGAFSTAVAYLLYFRLLARAGATNTSLVTFLIPVTAVLLGAFALGERLEPHQIAGMAVIAVGLVAIDGRAGRALARRRGRRKKEQPDDFTHT